MRLVLLGVISDVHGDDVAVERALDAVEGRVDEVWCAGDIVTQYRYSPRTVALLRGRGVRAIQGNHDAVLVSPAGAAARAAFDADDAGLSWLASLPRQVDVEVLGTRVRMVHASPWPPYDDYLPAHDRRWRRADELGVDILCTGHTHVPMVQLFGTTLVVNPGSVGEPRQRDDRAPTYAVVDVQSRSASIERLT